VFREIFKRYIKVSRGVSDSTVAHYITGINSINAILKKYNFSIQDMFSVKTIEELDSIVSFLKSNAEFVEKDSVGHNMYSAALNHFYRFACEDDQFFSHNIEQMDIPVNVPETIQNTVISPKRNQIIKAQAIVGANYACENNSEHRTFTSKATGKPYMEGHHLIPLCFQSEFNHSIDIYANVVCLCPTCHKLLHYGVDRERIYVAEKIFDFRSQRLVNSGIVIERSDFIGLLV